MKVAIVLILALLTVLAIYGFKNYVSPQKKAMLIAQTPASFFDLSYTAIDGQTVKMSSYRGKYVLCVNVASECGNTPQYAELEALYEKYKSNLVIIGFPCNQFGGQEPGKESEISEFCKKNYGVTFPLSSKVNVKGETQHPIYTWLTSQKLNGVADDVVEWNFRKYLISPEGKWLKSYKASADPSSTDIAAIVSGKK